MSTRQAFGHTLEDSRRIGMSELPPARVGTWKLLGRSEVDQFRVLIVGPEMIPTDVTIKTARNFLGRERRVG